ncbi:hypothetical protein BJ684DRAFT_14996 [Piptocephalis cylindrospora]|uniref:RING-type domain-containing protein n=1 Tax=Piptocephalis cylindrospora TaxID=1907219 RepID=A0A4V1IYI6_9FUNG|nr:hypothetical protein BJ684DRAFT_14996 [Piptocephalis cylindrospora]|eukprot:RKP14689.1 hypothetical protein BJ684DRAFT_14996 [Piptocephalis cylindrospora]
MTTDIPTELFIRLSPFLSPTDTLPRGYRETPAFLFEPIEKRVRAGRPILIGSKPWSVRTCATPDLEARSIKLKSSLVDAEHAALWLKEGNPCIIDVSAGFGTDCIQLGVEGVDNNGKLLRVRILVELLGEDDHIKIDMKKAHEWMTHPITIRLLAKNRNSSLASLLAFLQPNSRQSIKREGHEGLPGDGSVSNPCSPRSQKRRERDFCSICLVQLERSNVVKTSCGHAFHYLCIQQMTEQNHESHGVTGLVYRSRIFNCPLCRQRVDLGEEARDEDGGETYESAEEDLPTEEGRGPKEGVSMERRMERVEQMMSVMTLTLLSNLGTKERVGSSKDTKASRGSQSGLGLVNENNMDQLEGEGSSGALESSHPMNPASNASRPRVPKNIHSTHVSLMGGQGKEALDHSSPSRTVWIGGLGDKDPTRDQIIEIFEGVTNVRFVFHPDGMRKPYIFVDFSSEATAARALRLDGTFILGRRIGVRYDHRHRRTNVQRLKASSSTAEEDSKDNSSDYLI